MRFILIFIILLLNVCLTNAQQRTFCKQIKLVNDLLQTHHFNPKTIDDSLSVAIWQNFIQTLDPNKRYFLKNDLANFEKDKYQLDDYFKKERCKFIKPYVKTFEKRLKETKDILNDIRSENFEYPTTDTLYFDADREKTFMKNEADRKEDWQWFMRYETLSEATKRFEDKQDFIAQFDSIKPEVKNYVIDQTICAIDEILQHQNGFDTYVYEIFINSISTVYDPHSMYFNSAEKNAFEGSLSTNNLSFGIWTDKNDAGQIVVSYINPNSPAAFDNQIEVGDVLRSLKSGKSTLKTACLSNQEVVNFLTDKAHQVVGFEIEKSRGQIKIINLTKTNIPVEYNAVDTFIIDEDIKAAYVNIPSFYINTESGDWRGTSLDMGKALYKIMQEKAEGLIIDLRQNSGGSMKEAADLSNLFIDGPVAILKEKKRIISIYHDKSATVFKKPIVIMVDAYTASAAELFAGVLQDYGRAVIVGTETYGKATSQFIYELDPEDEQLGFQKITLEKFYRISGKSHQNQGIKPDIHISNLYENISKRENNHKYALIADTLEVSEIIEKFKLPLDTLNTKSQKRQENSETFQNIRHFNNQLQAQIFYKKKTIPFQPEFVYDNMNSYNSAWEDISEYFEDRSYLELRQTSTDQQTDTATNDKRIEMIMKYTAGDPTVFEAYHILKDLIKINKTANP